MYFMSMQALINIVANRPFKFFYNGVVPRKIRKKWNYEYIEKPKQQMVASYWQQVISLYQQGKLPSYEVQTKKIELVGKKIIWQYWGQGLHNLPEMAKICFASVDKYKGNYEIIRLSDDNITEYLQLPEFVIQKVTQGIFSRVFFSDLLRTALVANYGGVWLDASILLTDFLPQQYTNCDFFMFSRDKQSPNKYWGEHDGHFYFNWREEFKVNHLSSIIFGKANNEVLRSCLQMLLYFWQNETILNHYFSYLILINEFLNSSVNHTKFMIVDDTLPHILQSMLGKPFIEEGYKSIVDECPLQKLSVNHTYSTSTFGKQTFYGYIKQVYS